MRNKRHVRIQCKGHNMSDQTDKKYIDSNFNQLTLSDSYACKMQISGGGRGCTNWMNITNEQAKAIHALLSGDRVLGHDPSTQIALVWGIADIQNIRPGVTDEVALKVLQQAERRHNAEEGINWVVLENHLDELNQT